MPTGKERTPGAQWKSAVDRQTGRVYYYDPVTHETSWDRPRETTEIDQSQALFFRMMENNIRAKLQEGKLSSDVSSVPSKLKQGTASPTTEHLRTSSQPPLEGGTRSARGGSGASVAEQRTLRTLSSVDDSILIGYSKANDPNFRFGAAGKTQPRCSMPPPTTTRNGADGGGGDAVDELDLSGDLGSSKGSLQWQAYALDRAEGEEIRTVRESQGTMDWKAVGLDGNGLQSEASLRASLLSLSIAESPVLSRNGGGGVATTPPPNATTAREVPKDTLTSTTSESELPSSLEGTPPSRSGHQKSATEGGASRWQVPVREKRSNTGNTMFLSSTMGAPDMEATIQCVCTVLRAHMLEAVANVTTTFQETLEKNGLQFSEENAPLVTDGAFFEAGSDGGCPPLKPIGKAEAQARLLALENDDFAVFNEGYLATHSRPDAKYGSVMRSTSEEDVPQVLGIANFIRDVFRRSQMEPECLIMTLIYAERLLQATKGKLQLRNHNWRPVVFSAMIMASKVWDDLSMWNVDFSKVLPSFCLQRINELETAVLHALGFNVRVGASSYAKYYFHLRSMCTSLGLRRQEQDALPLNMDGAKKLEELTMEYQERAKDPALRRRCKTLHVGADANYIENLHKAQTHKYVQSKPAPVSLEQVVSSTIPKANEK